MLNKLLFIGLLLGCLSTTAYCLSEHSAVNIAVDGKFFNELKDTFIPILINKLDNATFPDYIHNFDAKILQFEFNSTNMKMTNVYMDVSKTGVTLKPNNAIHFYISSAQAKFDFDYGINTRPTVVYDKGPGLISVTQMDISFNAVLDRGMHQELKVNITDVQVGIKASDLIISLNGPADISKALNFIINELKKYFVSNIPGKLAPKVQTILQNMVNKSLNKIDYLPQIKNTPLFANYSLMQAPVVTNEYVELFLNGSFFIHNKTIIPNSTFVLPQFTTLNKEIEFYIASYTLESGLDAMHQAGMLNTTVEPVQKIGSKTYYINTTTLGIFVPNFIDAFGRDKPVTTSAISEDPAPTLSVTPTENTCHMSFKVDQTVNNGTHGNVKALTIHLDVEFAVRISTVGKYVIPAFDVVNITIKSYESTMGDIDTNSLNMLINFLEALMLPILNAKFSQGFELPIVKDLVDLTNTTVATDDGFIRIETTPKMIVGSELETERLSSGVEPVSTFAQQVEKISTEASEIAQYFSGEIMKSLRGFLIQQA